MTTGQKLIYIGGASGSGTSLLKRMFWSVKEPDTYVVTGEPTRIHPVSMETMQERFFPGQVDRMRDADVLVVKGGAWQPLRNQYRQKAWDAWKRDAHEWWGIENIRVLWISRSVFSMVGRDGRTNTVETWCRANEAFIQHAVYIEGMGIKVKHVRFEDLVLTPDKLQEELAEWLDGVVDLLSGPSWSDYPDFVPEDWKDFPNETTSESYTMRRMDYTKLMSQGAKEAWDQAKDTSRSRALRLMRALGHDTEGWE